MLKQGLLDEATGPFATFYTKFPVTSVIGQHGCLRGISACLPGRRCDGARGITAKNIGHILAVSRSIHAEKLLRRPFDWFLVSVPILSGQTYHSSHHIKHCPAILLPLPCCSPCTCSALEKQWDRALQIVELSHHFRGLGPAIL